MTTLRGTARLARPLWFGSILVGGFLGGASALALALHLTREKGSER